MKQEDALNKAIKFFGSMYKIADALDCSRQTIYYWRNKAKTLEKGKDLMTKTLFAKQIEELSGGKIKAKWLCPETYKAEKKIRKS